MWLLGKALSPFLALFLVWAVTRPASRYVQRRMPDGWVKRLLLIDSEKNPRAYAVGCALLIGVALAICIVGSVLTA